MKTLLTSLALGLVALLATDRAEAAPLNAVTDAPVIDVPVATADYIEFFGIGDLSIIGAEGLSFDLVPAGPLLIDIFVDFDVADPSGTAGGALFSVDDDGVFLDGALVRTGFDDDVLQLLFGGLTGPAAGDFGRFVLAELVFIDPVPGTDPLASFVDETTYDVAATLSSVSAIPLPAALPMLAAGLGGLVLLRRRG